MAQIKTRELSTAELEQILEVITKADVKLALYLEANMGFRISDTIRITRDMIANRRIQFDEVKTGKDNARVLTADESLTILNFMDNNKVSFKQFPKTADKEFKKYLATFSRKVQREIKTACEKVGIDSANVSTHSFRKYYATTVYVESEQDIMLVSKLLNHSSIATTQKYLGIDKEKLAKFSFVGRGKLI